MEQIEKLRQALAKTGAELLACNKRQEAINQTKDRYLKAAAAHAEKIRAKAEQGDEKAEVAYLNLVRAQRLMAR